MYNANLRHKRTSVEYTYQIFISEEGSLREFVSWVGIFIGSRGERVGINTSYSSFIVSK